MSTHRLASALADRYHLERELGQGGMATVYLARDLKHDRQVAIKVLKPELAAVLGADRFVQEIKTTAALQHPHILPLFDSGSADGFLYYVMPYIEGETLRIKLDREHQLGVDEAVKITTEVADALDYAHRHGVIHRDIKPENILLHDGRPMVADFGIALAVSAAAGGRMTETGLSLGTPHYMSPEQATAEKEITARSDVYSLASVLYEMLTGNPPHTGSTAQQIIMKIIAEPVPVVTSLRKSVPRNVAAALEKALEKLPADRFATAKEFSDALTNPSFTTTAAAVPAGVAGRRHVVVAAGVLLAAGGLAGGWLLGRAGRAPVHAAAALSTSVLLPDLLQLAPELLMSEGTETLALSPDGRQLVFAARHGDASQLYLRTLSRFDLRPLDGTAGAQAPFFSPSGDLVYFFGPRGLMRVTLADGRVALVRRAPPSQFAGEAWGGTVMADGRVVLSQGYTSYLIVLTPAGDSVRTIACTTSCGFPKSLPDGRHVLFGNGIALWVVDLETGKRAAVMQPAASGGEEMLHAVAGEADRNGHLVYATLDGRLYAAPFDAARFRVTGPAVAIADSVRLETGRGGAQFAVSPSGVLVYAPGDVAAVGILVRADRSGKIDTIPAPPDDYDGLALSPDGRRLAVHASTAGGDRIEVIDVATGKVTPWLAGRSLGLPSWTTDGRQLVCTRGDTGLIGDPDQNTAPTPLPPGTGVGHQVYALSDSGTYLAASGDSVWVIRGGRRIGSAVAGLPRAIYTPTGDGRWLIQPHLGAEGVVEALALDGSARRVVIAPEAFVSFTTVAGGMGLTAVTAVARSVDGRAETEETFYSMSYDPSSTSPFGSLQKLFSATVADFPGRNYTVGMGGNRFVFKRHVASPPLREVRVMTSWSAMLSPGAER
jgi:tRNA A-37 threonylcarbamoyl transferase component Bud32/Tol biopolymer transport system component